MHNDVTQYKKQLKRKLYCSNAIKARLMHQFENTLNIYLEDHARTAVCLTDEDLRNAFGPPDEMARVLMEEVPDDEIVKYRRGKWIWCFVGALVLAAILSQIVYLSFFKSFSITSNSEIIIDGTETNVTEDK